MDRPHSSRGGYANVQGGPCTVPVALGAADGDAGGPVAPKLHVGPSERGGFGAPKQGVPHDRCEHDIHQTAAAGLAGPLGSTARSRAPQMGSRTDRGSVSAAACLGVRPSRAARRVSPGSNPAHSFVIGVSPPPLMRRPP